MSKGMGVGGGVVRAAGESVGSAGMGQRRVVVSARVSAGAPGRRGGLTRAAGVLGLGGMKGRSRRGTAEADRPPEVPVVGAGAEAGTGRGGTDARSVSPAAGCGGTPVLSARGGEPVAEGGASGKRAEAAGGGGTTRDRCCSAVGRRFGKRAGEADARTPSCSRGRMSPPSKRRASPSSKDRALLPSKRRASSPPRAWTASPSKAPVPSSSAARGRGGPPAAPGPGRGPAAPGPGRAPAMPGMRDGSPVLRLGKTPGALVVACVASPDAWTPFGEVGSSCGPRAPSGGADGRGGVGERRASVLMHPPLPRTRATGPPCPPEALLRSVPVLPARHSTGCHWADGNQSAGLPHLPGTSPYRAIIRSGGLRIMTARAADRACDDRATARLDAPPSRSWTWRHGTPTRWISYGGRRTAVRPPGGSLPVAEEPREPG